MMHPPPEWILNRHDAAKRLPPLLSGVRDPFEGIQSPVAAALIASGSRAQSWCAGFHAGALDGLREAWRQCCPECRTTITTVAARYHHEWEAA